ncbi:MAG: hypothetical protein H6822_19895 [Planctomycetaceae bacterium]|nr:hypothetical protein [Planctomycetales bacterium]MCB9924451.1 hypothetical protein [Planctomycetaceae bacterium]
MSHLLLEAAISNLFFACLLSLLAFFVTSIFRNQELAHVLWLLVLAKLVTPPLWTIELPTLTTTVKRSVIFDASNFDELNHSIVATSFDPMVVDLSENDRCEEATLRSEQSDATATPTGSAVNRRQSSTMFLVARTWCVEQYEMWLDLVSGNVTMIACGWFAASVTWLVVVFARVVSFNRLLRHHAKPNGDLRRMVIRIAAQLRLARVPDVRVTDAAIGPLVWPLARKASIVLPNRLVVELGNEQLEVLRRI